MDVNTTSGPVRGITTGTTTAFRGIPYATAKRFQPPTPSPKWTDTKLTVEPGPAAPQLRSRLAHIMGEHEANWAEDGCLNLNVWTTGAETKKPVLFWIHGGGFSSGSGGWDWYDGGLLAAKHDIVVVTMNYRLGPFGYLGTDNLGAQDQRAALEWVRDNIAAFGGDPRQVTIGGESAGGWSVCAHLSAPGSRGLFARAVMESGSCYSETLSEGEAAGETVAQAVGCTDPATAAACLRAVPAGTLLDNGPPGVAFVRNVPELPADPATAVATGAFARVPVLVGANRDEGRTFSQGAIGLTEQQYDAWVAGTFGAARSPAILTRYPWPATADQFTPAYLIGAIETDSGLLAGIGGCTNRTLTQSMAKYTRTYAYQFDHRTGPGLAPQPAGYVWGAGHAAELAYLWPSFNNGTPIAPTFNAAERKLASDMIHYWGTFVRGETPQSPHSASWSSYNKSATTMSLRAGGHSTMITDNTVATEHQCNFWSN